MPENLEVAWRAGQRDLLDDSLELNGFIQSLLNAIAEAGFERVIFGFVTSDGRWIRGRLAAGRDGAGLLERFLFQAQAFPKEDRVDDGTALVQQFDPGSFLLLPVILSHKLAGCLYADRVTVANWIEFLRPDCCRIRELIARAIRRQVDQA